MRGKEIWYWRILFVVNVQLSCCRAFALNLCLITASRLCVKDESFDNGASRHRSPRAIFAVSGLIDYGFEVTVTTLSESIEESPMKVLTRNTESGRCKSLRLIPAQAEFRRPQSDGAAAANVARDFTYWRLFRWWYKKYGDTVQPDVAVLPCLDYCLYAIGLLGPPFGGCPWAGLAMRPSFHYRQMELLTPPPSFAVIKKVLFLRLLKNRYLRSFLTTDEPLVQFLAGKTGVAKKIVFLPEPSDINELPESHESKRRFGVPDGRKVAFIYGAITVCKEVPKLLQALSGSEFPSSVDVLLARKMPQKIHETLALSLAAVLLNKGSVRLVEHFIENEEAPALFACV